jgi:hypothetical protein
MNRSRLLLRCAAAIGVLVGSLASASAAQDGSSGAGADSLLTLDVRVHLLHSPDSEALTTTLTEQEVTLVFDGVNAVWARAGIQWRVTSIDRAAASNGRRYERAHRGEGPRRASIAADIIPRDRLSGGFDVFFVRHIGIAPGIYLPPLAAVVQAETDPDGLRALEGGLVRILSHELGHALSLSHVPCPEGGNLMAPGCVSGERTRLTQRQIEQARKQAASGTPYRGAFSRTATGALSTSWTRSASCAGENGFSRND